MEFIKPFLYGIASVLAGFALIFIVIGGAFFPGFCPFHTMKLAYKQRKGKAVLLNKKELLDFLQRDKDIYGVKLHDFMLYGKLEFEPIYLRTWDWFIMGLSYARKKRRSDREEKNRAEKNAAREAYAHVKGHYN